jgi:O-antigen/teichoic acid export membrane protein
MAVVFYKRTVKSFPPNTEEDPGAFSYGRHLSGMNVLGTVATNLDKLLVFQFLGAASLASYALAILLPDRLAGGFKPLFLTAFPRFAKRSLTEIRHSIVQKTGLVLLVATLASVLYAIIVPSLIYLVYPNYAEIIPYSQVYAFTFIATAGHLATTALMAHKRLKELYLLNTILPLTQIAMLIVGITFWGLWGVIIARVIYSLLFSVSAFGFLKYWTGRDYNSH